MLERLSDCKEIRTVNPIGNQPWIFIRRTDAEALGLRPSEAKSRLIVEDPDGGKDWGQEEKGVTEDEMVGGITDSVDMSLSKLQETVEDGEAWCAVVHGGHKESDRT